MIGRKIVAVVAVFAIGFPACERVAVAHNNSSSWRAAAISAGWPAKSWPRLRCVIARESAGNPRAVGDTGRAIGLTQIRWDVHHTWLSRAGYTREALMVGRYNLRAARLLYDRSERFTGDGWAPWRSRRSPC